MTLGGKTMVASNSSPAPDSTRSGWACFGVSFLALIGTGLTLVAGCVGPSATLPPLPLARDLPADTTLWLPASRPPDLIDANLTSGNDTPIIDFYSLNESIVSVCQATQERCLGLMPTAQVIPRSDTVPSVTLLINAHENGVVPLTKELERYWTEVDLVAGRPAWLGAP